MCMRQQRKRLKLIYDSATIWKEYTEIYQDDRTIFFNLQNRDEISSTNLNIRENTRRLYQANLPKIKSITYC